MNERMAILMIVPWERKMMKLSMICSRNSDIFVLNLRGRGERWMIFLNIAERGFGKIMVKMMQRQMREMKMMTSFRLMMVCGGMRSSPMMRKMRKHNKSMARSMTRAENDLAMGISYSVLYMNGRASSTRPGRKLPAAIPARTD